MNFSRRLVLNILFIVLVIMFFMAITSDDDKVVVPEKSVLVLNLNGKLVEEKTYVDPVEAAINDSFGNNNQPRELLTDDVVQVINEAAKDERIHTLLFKLEQLQSAHLNKLAMIASAIENFKASGKKVLATGYYYTQSQYYLASYADEISVHPYGGVLIEGFSVYPTYYKDAIEKLKITQHVFRVGTFKAAVEPLIRNDMSPAAKEANKAWLDALWSQYKTVVAKNRGFEQSNFDETLDGYLAKLKQVDGNVGRFALDHGWVDSLKNNLQVRDELIALVGESEDGKSFKQISFNDYLTEVKPPIEFDNPVTEKVAVVVARGMIVDGSQKAGMIGGDSTAALLRKARLDEKVKAVVLRVDSGGGSMFASEVIRNEVLALKEAGKPVIASMSSVAASGGYWISSAANQIWAAPSTITGSIGVFGQLMTFEKAANYVGVHSDGVATTQMAGFSLLRELNPKIGEMIQLGVENAYALFLDVVANARNMTPEEVDAIAQGRVWIATQALELGLIDKIGNKQQAIEAAAELAGLKHYDVITVKQSLSPKEQFIQDMFKSATVQSWLPKENPLDAHIGIGNRVEQMLREVQTQAQSLRHYNDPNAIYAKCLVCDISN